MESNETAKADFIAGAYNTKPGVIIGPVGWTSIKPENVLNKKDITKQELKDAYAKACEEFYLPVQEYLTKEAGIPNEKIALVTSASYDGVDKHFMDMAQKKNIPTGTISPVIYTQYAKNEHPFPLVITNEVSDYADLYRRISDITLVTGGREHTWKYDFKNQLIDGSGTIIPVDIMKDFAGIEIPALINDKTENAARLIFDKIPDPYNPQLFKTFKDMPSGKLKNKLKHPAQQALAAAIFEKISKASA